MRGVLLVGLLAAVPLAGAAAQSSVAGEWDASYNTPGGVRNFKLVFVVKGDSLSGTVKRTAGEVPLTGTIFGDTVRFAYMIEYGGNALDIRIVAKVTGDTMAGTVDFGGAAQEEFSAKRSR